MSKQIELFRFSQNTFYNTISLTGSDLKEANSKAARQEDRVLELFRSAGIDMTPEDVEARYNALFAPAPLTSFRRAITNLTNSGHLEKCDNMGVGRYGKPVHFWKLSK